MTDVLAPISRNNWDRSKARHLLNRAGFGVPLSAVDALSRVSPAEAVEMLVDFERFRDSLVEPDFLFTPMPQDDYRRMVAEIRERIADPEQRAAAIQRLQNEQRRAENEAVQGLKDWWLSLMQFTSRPLQEKMALFWHGHFATSAEKVQQSRLNYQLNKIFRDHATGNFKALVTAVGKSPAMLIYLDNRQNRKSQPNENWARELMELFTMGIGNYTEDDIKQAARAFTGWTHIEDRFVYNIGEHDFGQKQFLGKTGLFDGEAIIDIIFEQPAVATFICGKLWKFFVNETIDAQAVEALAKTFRESNYDLKPVLRQLFLSQRFYDAKNIGNQIKSPVQLIIGMLDGLRATPSRNDRGQRRLVQIALRAMGQNLLEPPNVKGWDGNRAWISSNSLLIRYNIGGFLTNGQVPQGVSERFQLEDSELDIERLEREQTALRRRIRAPFDAVAFFQPYAGKKVGDVVDALVAHFVGRPIDADQRAVIARALSPRGDENAVLDVAAANEINLRAGVHLLLSMAEFQLC